MESACKAAHDVVFKLSRPYRVDGPEVGFDV